MTKPQTIIIMIYKNKLLLASKDNYHNLNEKLTWNFINMSTLKKIGIDSKKVTQDKSGTYFLKLTEENVHKIVRKDGSRLEFYGISELDKISLTPDSEEMYSQYKEAISRITTEA